MTYYTTTLFNNHLLTILNEMYKNKIDKLNLLDKS